MISQLAAGFVVVGLAFSPVGFAGEMANKAEKASASVQENVGDAAITAKIKTEFAKDKAVSAMNINVDTDNKGAVTLKGTAKSKAESDKAVSIAKSVKGVTSVKNELIVETSAKK
jgi:osmotically-inducible protein OsmY